MINVCMIGHEGHGKSSVSNQLPAANLNVEDPPKKVKKLLTRLAKADVAILVVSAVDGPMAQTQEHIILANALKVQNIVVYINKVDLVEDPEVLELIEIETRSLLSTYGYSGNATTFIYGSAKLASEGDTSYIGVDSIKQLEEAILGYSVVVKPTTSLFTHKTFLANLTAFDAYQGGRHTAIKTGYTPSFFFDSEVITGAIKTDIDINPGTSSAIVVSLIKATGLGVGSSFVVREGNKTIGTGTVISILE